MAARGRYQRHIPHTDYPLMFHGNEERIDTESRRLSVSMWEALTRAVLA